MLVLENNILYFESDNERVMLQKDVFNSKSIEQCNLSLNYTILSALNSKDVVYLFNLIHSICLYFKEWNSSVDVEIIDINCNDISYSELISNLYDIEVVNIDLLPNIKSSSKSNVKLIVKLNNINR